MPFQQFELHAQLLANLQAIGYTDPTPIQVEAIPAILRGSDVVGIAQTGTGKTAAFLLPIMHELLQSPRGRASTLILTPTRELAQQIEANFRRFAVGTALRSVLVVGGAPEFPQERALRGNVDLVVATPGRLLAHLRGRKVNLDAVRTLILDEADQMFDLGFFPDLQRVIRFLPARKQTLLFSATMPAEVEQLSRDILREPSRISITPQGSATPTVSQTVYPVSGHRKAALLEHLLEQMERPSVLVFTKTKHGARQLANHLREVGHDVGELHSGRTPLQRMRTMQAFRNKVFPILIATNLAARGLDVRHITHVVNFDVAGTPEEHVHRIGRAGRAGDEGEALVLLAPEEYRLMSRIERRVGRLRRLTLPDFDYGNKQTPPPRRMHRSPRPHQPRVNDHRGPAHENGGGDVRLADDNQGGEPPRDRDNRPLKPRSRKPTVNKGLSENNFSDRRKPSRGQGRR